MADSDALRDALVALHRELLETVRIEAERTRGRMSAAELLQAASDDLRFRWLGYLSEVITDFDEGRKEQRPGVDAELVERTRALLAPPDPGTGFGGRYLRALQEHPSVVLAHRDVLAHLPADEPEDESADPT